MVTPISKKTGLRLLSPCFVGRLRFRGEFSVGKVLVMCRYVRKKRRNIIITERVSDVFSVAAMTCNRLIFIML